jgi:pimeloyl-ACP methyl ester carboxylesterase
LDIEVLEPAPSWWTVRRLVGGLRSPTRWQRALLRRRFVRAGLALYRMPLSDQGHLSVWVGGSGSETLVLLHGFGSSCLWQWADMVGKLGRAYRLIIPDLLWFGDSDGGGAERSLATQANAIERLIREHGGDAPVHLAGISYGGFIAYLLANDHPELVRRLVLIDCPATAMTRGDYDAVLAALGISDMNELLVPASAAELPRLINVAYHRPPALPGFALADAYRTLFSQHIAARRALLDDLVRYLDSDRPSGGSEHPVLLIWGEHDAIFPLALAKRLQSELGDRAQLVLIKDTAHAPIVEAPRVVNRALMDFLGASPE